MVVKLTDAPVMDDPGDADYSAAPRNARRNGAARLRFHIDGNIEMKRPPMVGRVGAEGQQRNTYGIKGSPQEAVDLQLQSHSSSVQVAIASNAFHPAHPMQRALRLILGGLASVFCVIETMLEVTRRPLTAAAERLDALYAIADELALASARALYILVHVVQLAVVRLPAFVVGIAVLGLVVRQA